MYMYVLVCAHVGKYVSVYIHGRVGGLVCVQVSAVLRVQGCVYIMCFVCVYLCGWVSVCDGSRDQGVDSVLSFPWNSVVSAGTPLTSNTIIKTKEADISSLPQDIIKDYTGSRVRDKQMNQNGCVEDSMEEGQCSLDASCSETDLLRV